jgi:hypothetical protein
MAQIKEVVQILENEAPTRDLDNQRLDNLLKLKQSRRWFVGAE